MTTDQFESLYKFIKLSQKNGNGSGKNTDKRPLNQISKRGFGSMDTKKQHEIAKKGGQARKEAAQRGEAPSYQEIGREGGEMVSHDREHMARIGRKGGKRTKTTDQQIESE